MSDSPQVKEKTPTMGKASVLCTLLARLQENLTLNFTAVFTNTAKQAREQGTEVRIFFFFHFKKFLSLKINFRKKKL